MADDEGAGRTPNLPDGWYELFSWDSHPASIPARSWPALADVIAHLDEQHERMRQILERMSEQALSAPAADHPGTSIRFAVVHALHDEAYHCGEIHLLRKLKRIR